MPRRRVAVQRPFSRAEANLATDLKQAGEEVSAAIRKERAYLGALEAFLHHFTPSNRKLVQVAASQLGANHKLVAAFYTPGKGLAKCIDTMLGELVADNQQTWARLLQVIAECNSPLFKTFKQFSPFREQLLLLVDLRGNTVSLKGDAAEYFGSLVGATPKQLVHDGAHLIALPYPAPRDVVVLCSTSSCRPRSAT